MIPRLDLLVIELTTEHGRILLGGATGAIRLLLSPEETTALTPGTLRHEPFLRVPGTHVTCLAEGNILVAESVVGS